MTEDMIVDMLDHRESGLDERTKAALKYFLDYCNDNPDAVKLYVASDMILFVDSDAAYLVESEAKSRAGGFFYLGNKDGKLINGSILILAKIIKFVMASTAEAEIVAFIYECKTSSSDLTSLNRNGTSTTSNKNKNQ